MPLGGGLLLQRGKKLCPLAGRTGDELAKGENCPPLRGGSAALAHAERADVFEHAVADEGAPVVGQDLGQAVGLELELQGPLQLEHIQRELLDMKQSMSKKHP